MSEKSISNGRRAYKLYNKVGATDKDKLQAQILMNDEKPEDLDVYGKFVYAEIIFWKRRSNAYTYAQAIEIFQKILLDKQLPRSLTVGACFYLGRCYELGLGTEHNINAAYAHYRLANKLNPKACVKDIERIQNILNSEAKAINKSTPDKYKFNDVGETDDDELEYQQYLREWDEEYSKCKKSLKNNKFFYADDPDEVNVDDIPLDAFGRLPPLDDDE